MFTRRFFIILLVCIALSVASLTLPALLTLVKVLLALLALCTLADALFVVWASNRVVGTRKANPRMSLSQPNKVSYEVRLKLPDRITHHLVIEVMDSPPPTFTVRGDVSRRGAGSNEYHVQPSARGRYEFGALRCFVRTRYPGLFEWRNFSCIGQQVKVYPTFRNLESIENESVTLNQQGQQRVRRIGNSTCFEQIRDYVPGDDVRTINWKATARSATLKVNTYTDEHSRKIIPVVCAGPSMLESYGGVTLLDRAVSAAVALGASAVRHYDEAGLIGLTHLGVDHYIKPDRSASTVAHMLEYLSDFGLPPTPLELRYVDDADVLPDDLDETSVRNLLSRIKSTEADPDFDALAKYVQVNIRQRSLLVIFANFNNLSMANLMVPVLHAISRRHTLMVVLFRNEDVEGEAMSAYRSDQKVSQKVSEQRLRAMCADYVADQINLVSKLRQRGINVVLTTPANLSADVIRCYLDLKNRNVI